MRLLCVLLLAVAPPAWAWTPAQCQNEPNATAFRDMLVDNLLLAPATSFNMIAPCRASVPGGQQAAFDACVLRAHNYAELLQRPGLGLNVTNANFEANYRAVLTIPAVLQDQTLFTLLQATNLSNAASVNATVARIRQLVPAAIVLPYVSPTTPSIDNAPGGVDRRGRIVVWLNDAAANVSRYIQFSVNANAASVSGTAAGAIQRTQASVVMVKRANPNKGTYIFDWQRSAPAAHTYTYQAAFGNDQKCYGCHANGVLAIHPFESGWAGGDDVGGAAASLGAAYAGWLDALNNTYRNDEVAMNAQINADWANVADVVAEAPTRAQVAPGATFPDGLLDPSASAACTTAQKTAVAALKPRGPLSWTAWGADWGKYTITGFGKIWNYDPAKGPTTHTCITCHQNRGKALYDPQSYGNIMTKYVDGGFMPPNIPAYDASGGAEVRKNSVPLATRSAARVCFEADLEARVKAWLKATACP